MSSDLKSILIETAQKECHDKLKKIKNNLTTFQDLLLKISEQKKYTLTLWVLGEDMDWKIEKDFDILEKAGLICAKMRYSDQSGYLEYSLTNKGKNIVETIKTKTPLKN